jgi:hypothetical protein
MSNIYYTPTGEPVFLSFGLSSKLRNEFTLVQAGFDGLTATVTALASPAQALEPVNVNPDFLFDQVNEGALYTVSATANEELMDGWNGTAAGAGVFKIRRLADPDNAALKCMEITCTAADVAIGATDYYGIASPIEGYDIAWAGFGTSQLKQLTLQFGLKTSVTGAYGVALSNSAGDRRMVGVITVANTNANEYSFTWTPDSTGTWLYTNGTGLRLHLTLAAGTDYHATAGAWGAGAQRTTSAQANFMSNTSNIAYLKRCHLVQSSVALPYAPADAGRQLAKCQRYFWKSFPQGAAVATGQGSTGALAHIVTVGGAGQADIFQEPYPCLLRAAPTLTFYNPVNGNALWYSASRSADSGAATSMAANDRTAAVLATQLAADDAGHRLIVHATANARLA